jgi:hypothetical protein
MAAIYEIQVRFMRRDPDFLKITFIASIPLKLQLIHSFKYFASLSTELAAYQFSQTKSLNNTMKYKCNCTIQVI